MAAEKLPPNDREAETSCLASILLSRDARLKVMQILHPEDFYIDTHTYIYQTIIELDRKKIPIDLITLKQRLIDLNLFDKIGGDTALVEIYQITSTSANAEYYANRIKEFSLRRKLIDASADIIKDCNDRSIDTIELLNEIERKIFNITEKRITHELVSLEEVLQDTIKEIHSLHEHKKAVTGLASGFTKIDEMLTGFHESELIIIASRPSMGKTSLALNIANNIAIKEKKMVLFFSLEMPATQLAMRLLCIEARIDSQRVRTGHISSEELIELNNSSEKLGTSKIYIDDSPALTILDISAKTRRMERQDKVGLVIVDYMQLITSMSRIDRHLQIAEISRSLKQLAREINAPVIALSQLSRAVESRVNQVPLLSDLRESGAIEQDADVVIFIYREERVKKETDKKGIADIIIAKQRNGPIGTVQLAFIERHTKFGNMDTVYTTASDL